MSDSIAPKLSKWPFLLGDALLLGMACFITWQCKFTLGHWELSFVVLCVVGGALLGITPFLLEYDALVKATQANAVTTVASQLKNLEAIAAQINGATGRWQDAQDAADQTSRAAKEIAERMAAELKAFTEFMQRANDTERANLRLEVEKLRRAEGEWLQVLVHVLDHVYALHLGAVRSGQSKLIEQLGSFQKACRDAARRLGLTPFTAAESEPFDDKRHQVIGDGPPPPPDALIAETVAAGYTFQGKLLRPAAVRLRATSPASPAAPSAAEQEQQNQLPLASPAPNP